MAQLKVRIKAKLFLQILARRNMSQNSFGRGAELTSGHVSQLLSGKRNVSPKTRTKILSVLGVPFEDVFEERFSWKR